MLLKRKRSGRFPSVWAAGIRSEFVSEWAGIPLDSIKASQEPLVVFSGLNHN